MNRISTRKISEVGLESWPYAFGLLIGVIASMGLYAEDKKAPSEEKVSSAQNFKLPPSPAPKEDREGLEGGGWLVEGYGNPGKVAVVRPEGQERNRMLRVDYAGAGAEKVAAKHVTGLGAGETGSLRCHVHCVEDKPPPIALALCTGDEFLWQETPTFTMKKGWNIVAFDLGARTWKSASSQWKHGAGLQNRSDVRAVVFLVFNRKASGTLYLDALRIDRDGHTKGIKVLIAGLGSEEFEIRERSEKALLEVGRRALGSLREAAESGDPEVATRAKRLLKKLTAPKRKR